ncbi:tight adherence protein G [Mesocricetibacter intestinalis]|uniref:Tight adherence protein G n=1 Tax=Mesocricetibacter intestinalis TaxID=1521930 RepID=A0A4R6VC17_9PAST|nr:TadE/TadG family type IV pilus assembly protein [Mesocricetibacter intestinalis]TDQ57629.1 tight adherence protein G [Mesocricetibacter intestinalis]
MKKGFYFTAACYRAWRQFYKNERGVYTVLMGLLGFVLIGLVALAVDGSGLLLDKARFVQGMEQAALALVAENNANRETKEHSDIKRQSDPNRKLNLSERQDKRNKELIAGITRVYYLGNTYRPGNSKVKDDYQYQCDFVLRNDGTEGRSVACEVAGSFDRPSWLYLKDAPLSFEKTNKISSGAIYAQKNRDDVAPLDLMLVSDFTGSMRFNVNGGKDGKSKIDILKSVVRNLSDDLLDEKKAEREGRAISPYNRIGFTAFAFGAQQDSSSYCDLPYLLLPRSKRPGNVADSDLREYARSSAAGQYGPYLLEKSIDYRATIENIDKFSGKTISYPLSIPKGDRCLFNDNRATTRYWYGQKDLNSLKNTFSSLSVNGATLASSGILVGANYLMDVNTDPKAQPSELKTNTQRILLILSDGKDELNASATKDYGELSITPKLIEGGMCSKIQKKLDSLQDPKYAQRRSRVAFVAFGYPPEGRQRDAWLQCVGKHYYRADNEKELLDAFRRIIGLEEEVGHSLNKKPKFSRR